MADRLSRVRSYLGNLDSILFTSRQNLHYICGFTGTDGVLLVGKHIATLFVDSRYILQARQQTQGVDIVKVRKRWDDIQSYVSKHGIKTIGIESNAMDVDTFMLIKERFKDVDLVPMGERLKGLRAIKDSSEIELLKKAALISERALYTVLEKGIRGRKERDIALDLEFEMRRMNASAVSFELIVASGDRSAMPHGVASDKVIEDNDVVIIDFGCIYMGYCSDQTVTIATGQVGDEVKDVYECVRDAQARAMMEVRPGMSASELDSVARDVIKDCGYGDYFGHGLGHGVGMEIHEAPGIYPLSKDVLLQGMVFTIEPGIYLPFRFGVRLEDTVLLGDSTCHMITNIDKNNIKIVS